MKIKLALIALFSFLSVSVLAVDYSVADETFSIVKIEKDAGGKKVTVFLDHDVSYSTLAAWPGSRGPKIIPRVNHSWDFSFLRLFEEKYSRTNTRQNKPLQKPLKIGLSTLPQ